MTLEELQIEIQDQMCKIAKKFKLVENGYAVERDGIKLTTSGIAFAKTVAESLYGDSGPRHDPRLN
jgi:hypothetical protein